MKRPDSELVGTFENVGPIAVESATVVADCVVVVGDGVAVADDVAVGCVV